MLALLSDVRVPNYVVYPLIAGVVYGVMQWTAYRATYYPMRHPGGWWEQQESLGARDVWLRSSGGVKLHAWWAPAPDSQFATLYLHGNAGNISHRGSHLQAINRAGSSVLIPDYRGYGKSEGRPSERGLYADADAGYNYLRAQGYAPERIIVHGESLGTAVAVELAHCLPVGGVILEAPFTSAGDVAQRIIPLVGPLLARGFRTKEKIASIDAPLLIIHGRQDQIIDFSMGQLLYEAAREPKSFWEIPSAGHNDIVETAGPEYARRLARFYSQFEID